MSRKAGRILAFQGLYSWDAGGMSKDEVLTLSWPKDDREESEDETSESQKQSSEPDMETATFARILIAGTIDNHEQIDELIKENLKGWDFDRVNKVTLAVLRLSVYCLLFQKEVEPPVVINEAIEIVKKYGQDEAFKFVNGVLDKINKKIQSA